MQARVALRPPVRVDAARTVDCGVRGVHGVDHALAVGPALLRAAVGVVAPVQVRIVSLWVHNLRVDGKRGGGEEQCAAEPHVAHPRPLGSTGAAAEGVAGATLGRAGDRRSSPRAGVLGAEYVFTCIHSAAKYTYDT